jgi:hypothetical protein
MFGRNSALPTGAALRVSTSSEEIGSHIYMKGVARLSVTIDLDVDSVMQEGQALILLIDISSSIEKIAESLQIFHFGCMMRWRHMLHRTLPIWSSRSVDTRERSSDCEATELQESHMVGLSEG